MVRNIVIAAAGRKLGKTLLSGLLTEALVKTGLSVSFVKLRKQKEAMNGLECVYGSDRETSDTARLKQAGAQEAVLVNYVSIGKLQEFLLEQSIFPSSDIILWETNSATSLIEDATVVYINADIEEPKKNSELIDTADLVLNGPFQTISEEMINLILSISGLSVNNPILPGWKLWLEFGGKPVFGVGVSRLLEAINDTGSILAASKEVGMQYRRAWTLLSNTEEKLGAKLIRRNRGGAGGGGSSLTPVATMLLKRFHLLGDAMTQAVIKLKEEI